jgi:hypothetical protein
MAVEAKARAQMKRFGEGGGGREAGGTSPHAKILCAILRNRADKSEQTLVTAPYSLPHQHF